MIAVSKLVRGLSEATYYKPDSNVRLWGIAHVTDYGSRTYQNNQSTVLYQTRSGPDGRQHGATRMRFCQAKPVRANLIIHCNNPWMCTVWAAQLSSHTRRARPERATFSYIRSSTVGFTYSYQRAGIRVPSSRRPAGQGGIPTTGDWIKTPTDPIVRNLPETLILRKLRGQARVDRVSGKGCILVTGFPTRIPYL